jgi:hypothetical protein
MDEITGSAVLFHTMKVINTNSDDRKNTFCIVEPIAGKRYHSLFYTV